MDENDKNQTKEREVLSEYQPYLPSIESVLNFSEYAETLEKPASRFKSPRSDADRLLVKAKRKIAEFAGFDELYSFRNPDYPVPPQWQEILDYLYEEGVITSPHVYFEPLFHDEPKIYSLRLLSTSIAHLTDGNPLRHSGYSRGISDDIEEAFSKVIGELLERYPLTLYRRKDLFRSSYRALKEKKKNPLGIFDLAGFADWQKELFPNRKFDDASEFHWAEGAELLSGRQALIPTQLIFWNYNFNQESREPFLRQPTTNGAAGHFTREEAILAGIYENIQRDAFLIHWLNRIAPPRIDIRTINDQKLRRVINNFVLYGFEIIFLNTTFDLGVPSCACVFIDHSGTGPKIGIGAGCGSNLLQALTRSITEATSVYHWLRTKRALFSLPADYKPFRTRDVDSESRMLLLANPESFSNLKWFLQGPIRSYEAMAGSYPSSFKNSEEELEYLKNIFRKLGKGYEIYVYEAKHRILEALGYHSVRIIIPALLPLYLEETAATLGAARLREVPEKMGYRPADEPFPWPHPFP